MPRPARQATCHPERPHLARGLCRACYFRAWKARPRPEGPRARARPRRAEGGPARRAPAPERASVRVLRLGACPKCWHGAASLGWDGTRLSCLLCGWDAYPGLG